MTVDQDLFQSNKNKNARLSLMSQILGMGVSECPRSLDESSSKRTVDQIRTSSVTMRIEYNKIGVDFSELLLIHQKSFA